MSLEQRLHEDMKLAMKSRDVSRLSTIRLLRSSVSYARIDKGEELTDDEVLEVLSREAKRRREAIEAAEAGGRSDVADRERAELEIINGYLPAQLNEAEIESVARRDRGSGRRKPAQGHGQGDGPLMQRIRGRADGKLAGQVVERLLRG